MTEMATWQKGIPLARLRRSAEVFKAHDEGLCLGAFSAFKENSVADAIDAERLLEADGVLADVEEISRQRSVKDFTGEIRARIQPGDCLVRRFAYREGAKDAAARVLEDLASGYDRLWIQTWVEHDGDREILDTLGFDLACVKIKASSELIGIYWIGEEPELEPLPDADSPALLKLGDGLPIYPLRGALSKLDPDYAGHYSAYGKGDSWSALALRGYSDDPSFIIKPTEMSKKWKAENAELMDAELRDTDLREQLPEAEALISHLPGTPHRIRLMRLAPGGGELKRHADITDPEAGTADGKTLRIHIPIASNPECVFEAWDLDGGKSEAVMMPGEIWYLDTRKPHTAVNNGDSERLHLVIDLESSEELRGIVEAADRIGAGLAA